MFNKNFVKISAIVLAGLFVVGCSPVEQGELPDSPPPVLEADATIQSLTKDTVDVLCDLSGKTVLEQTDIQSLRDMASLLEQYEGFNEVEARNVSTGLRELASTYETTVGIELPAEAAEQLVTGCDEITAAYIEAYGE